MKVQLSQNKLKYSYGLQNINHITFVYRSVENKSQLNVQNCTSKMNSKCEAVNEFRFIRNKLIIIKSFYPVTFGR